MEGVPASREYRGGFKAKDMSDHLAAAISSQPLASTALPMTQQALKLYKQARRLIHLWPITASILH